MVSVRPMMGPMLADLSKLHEARRRAAPAWNSMLTMRALLPVRLISSFRFFGSSPRVVIILKVFDMGCLSFRGA